MAQLSLGFRKRSRAAGYAVRLGWLQLFHDIEVDQPSFVSPTARFDFGSDGFDRGGSLRAAPGLRISHGAILAPYGGSIRLGRNAFIGPYTILCGHGGLDIGNDVLIAGHTMIIPANHGFDRFDRPISHQPETTKGIAIGDDVWIGSGVQILDGVTIGTGAVVAAGTVVHKSVDPMSVVAGVPARKIRDRDGVSGTLASLSAVKSTPYAP